MIFLGPVYALFRAHLQGRINHFPLIELIFYSLDKTILYLVLFFILRLVWKKWRHQKIQWRRELKLSGFVIYLLMLLFLTVFRDAYFPWQLQLHFHRPLSQINLRPLVETLKLTRGLSKLDFFYNFFGNILWFLPFGYGFCALSHRKASMGKVVASGCLFSICIESLQFLLYTGVSDIDDVIFNTLGATLGYGIYHLIHHRSQKGRA